MRFDKREIISKDLKNIVKIILWISLNNFAFSTKKWYNWKKKNRIILDMTWSMLKSKKMPKEFSAKAVDCAIYLSNRSRNQSVWNKTPKQSWNGKQ